MKIKDFIGSKVVYDEGSQMIFGIKKGEMQMLLDVRGWGAIQNLPEFSLYGKIDEKKADKFQDELGEWIAAAINEKL